MKKLLLIMLLSIATYCGAQEVKYCQLTGLPKVASSEMNIYLYPKSDLDVKQFSVMVDALNFMASKGWELVQYYSNVYAGQTSYCYILKKTESKK